AETLRLFALFEQLTGARVKDVVEEDDRNTFLVEEGQVGKAIGKGALNLQRLREHLKKDIEIVGYAKDPQQFVANLFHRFNVESIEWEDRNGDIIAHVKIPQEDRGKAIGKGGRNIQLVRQLAKRQVTWLRAMMQPGHDSLSPPERFDCLDAQLTVRVADRVAHFLDQSSP
ncbi:MAG: NusA-like transcription termination signal-binding factor, partial [Thermoplasmatota archaeon]